LSCGREMTRGYVKENQAAQSLPSAAFMELMASTLDRKAVFRFSAPGYSMTPFIRDGDAVSIGRGRVRYGDVVAFVKPIQGKLAVHRIVHVSRAGYLIKGDNSTEADGRVPASSIIGRVVRVDHDGKQVRLGLGIERIAIAWLSRHGWLTPLVGTARRFLKPVAKRRAG